MNKKGFSLVELIIVIAIMAILVGLMAPQLLKYVEKTNISSDVQLADTIKSAITVAITDARILEDPASQPYLAEMDSATGMNITNPSTNGGWDGNSILEESLRDAVALDFPDLLPKLRSENSNPTIKVYTAGNHVKVVIEGTHKFGKGRTEGYNNPANWITVD